LHAAVLGAALVLAAAGASAREWRFAVTIDSISVGEHRYVVDGAADARKVTVDARFRLHLLLVDAYAWEEHVEETWRGDCLERLDSRTIEQGRTTTVEGHHDGQAFVVRGPAGEAVVDACQMTFAYWNPNVLARHELINLQTGALTPVTVEDLGNDTTEVRGRATDTRHYRMRTARNTIELWYAGSDWVGMRTTTRDGHVVVYRLV
jgi:hypothetical protein